jgi:hypothetical protein
LNFFKKWPHHQEKWKKVEIFCLCHQENFEMILKKTFLKFEMKISFLKFEKKRPYHPKEMKKTEMKKSYISFMPPRKTSYNTT